MRCDRELCRPEDLVGLYRSRVAPRVLLPLLFAAAACVACGPGSTPVEVIIEVRAFGQSLPCAHELPTRLGPLRLSRAGFYLSEPQVRAPGADPLRIRLTVNDDQQESLALLRIDDGSQQCRQDGVRELRLVGSVEDGGSLLHGVGDPGLGTSGPTLDFTFTVGVPAEHNHANPALASPPLTVGSMHWGWMSGYQFMQVEGDLAGEPVLFHLGSSACDGTPPDIRCSNPNRIDVSASALAVREGERLRLKVAWDLTGLIEALADSVAGDGDGRCQSDPADPDCRRLFGGSLPGGGPVGLAFTGAKSSKADP